MFCYAKYIFKGWCFIMMQMLRNPKNVKLVSLFIAAIFVLGCFALSLTQSSFSKVASAAPSESAIGVVNMRLLVTQSPDYAKGGEEMKKLEAEVRKDFEEKTKTMTSDNEKKLYMQQCQDRMAAKEKEIMEGIMTKIEAQIKKIADKKGLKVVVEKSTVVFGGLDITDEVAKSMQTAK